MTKKDNVEARVESYLDRVRTALRGLPERQIDDIMRELRAHAIELAEGKGIEAAFASLGDPVDLAKAYRAESQIVRAECSSSTLLILQGLRHASRTRAGGFLATVLYVFGYVYVVALWLAADAVRDNSPGSEHSRRLLHVAPKIIEDTNEVAVKIGGHKLA